MIEIKQRLTHAHQHDIGDWSLTWVVESLGPLFVYRQKPVYKPQLADDLGYRQIARKPLLAGRAKRAIYRAAGLCGNAQSATIVLGNEYRLNRIALAYIEQPLACTIARDAITNHRRDTNFRLVDENGDIQAALQGRVPVEDELLYDDSFTGTPTPVLIHRRIMVAGERLVQASQGFDQRTNILLNAGALPADLRVIEERTVGAELGADSVNAGGRASIVGLAAVVVFMIASYGLFGVFAAIGLSVNMVVLIAVLTALQATLTLPGIAGMVLTMGMAVDSNVLIYERVREELAGGKSPISAIDIGFRRAMTAIIDSNLTTLLAALILFQLGSGPVRGFAVTLGLGIITSFFSAIMVNRSIIVVWLKRSRGKALNL